MNRILKLSKGATLLEIMLVLAIASMIILMSVRYYKTATQAQAATALISQIQQMTAAADSLGQGASGYSQVSTTQMQNAMGGSAALNTPWGSFTFAGAATSYVATLSAAPPAGVCSQLTAALTSNPRFVSVNATCLTYTYDATK